MLDTNTTLAAIEAYKADDVQAFVDTDVFETPGNLSAFMLPGVLEKNPEAHFWIKVWARRNDWIQQAAIMYAMTADNKASALSQVKFALAEGGETYATSHLYITFLSLGIAGRSLEQFKKESNLSASNAFIRYDVDTTIFTQA